jgi:tetratricopeptide (TPR) repeat protein
MKLRTTTVTVFLTLLIAPMIFLAGCTGEPSADILQKAEDAAAAGQWEHAQILAEKAAERNDLELPATILVALCQHYQDNTVEALDTIEKATNLDPASFAAQFFHGWMLCEEERWADALLPLKRALKLDPSNANVLVLLAKCSLQQNLIQGTSYLQALRRFDEYRDSAELYNAIALLWLGRPDYDMAKSYFLKALEKDPHNAVVLQNLAVLHDTYLNDETNALKHYKSCLRESQLAKDEVRAKAVVERLRQLAQRRSTASGGRDF